MKKLYRYAIEDDPTHGQFTKKISDILSDPRGWNRAGVYFKKVEVSDNPDCVIRLRSAAKTEPMCGFKNLSCFRPTEKDIIINHTNWNGGSKSELPIDRYRNYVINHEVGHALGLEHTVNDKKPGVASVMMQMSKGPKHIYPKKENDWPTNEDINELVSIKGGATDIELSVFFTSIIVVVCVVLIVYTYIRNSVIYDASRIVGDYVSNVSRYFDGR